MGPTRQAVVIDGANEANGGANETVVVPTVNEAVVVPRVNETVVVMDGVNETSGGDGWGQ